MLYVVTGHASATFLTSEIYKAYEAKRDVFIYTTKMATIRPFQALHSFYTIETIFSIFCRRIYEFNNSSNTLPFSIFIPQLDFDEMMQEQFFSVLGSLRKGNGDLFIGLQKTPYLHLLEAASCVKVRAGNHRVLYDYPQEYATAAQVNEGIYKMLKEAKLNAKTST